TLPNGAQAFDERTGTLGKRSCSAAAGAGAVVSGEKRTALRRSGKGDRPADAIAGQPRAFGVVRGSGFGIGPPASRRPAMGGGNRGGGGGLRTDVRPGFSRAG